MSRGGDNRKDQRRLSRPRIRHLPQPARNPPISIRNPRHRPLFRLYLPLLCIFPPSLPGIPNQGLARHQPPPKTSILRPSANGCPPSGPHGALWCLLLSRLARSSLSLGISLGHLGAMAPKRAPPACRGSSHTFDDANIPSHTVFHPVPSASSPEFDDGSPPPRAMKRRRTSAVAAPDDRNAVAASVVASDAASRNVAPFLAKHIHTTYSNQLSADGLVVGMESKKFCNRHRPDVKCRRQANEPTMEELQNVRLSDPLNNSNSSRSLVRSTMTTSKASPTSGPSFRPPPPNTASSCCRAS